MFYFARLGPPIELVSPFIGSQSQRLTRPRGTSHQRLISNVRTPNPLLRMVLEQPGGVLEQ